MLRKIFLTIITGLFAVLAVAQEYSLVQSEKEVQKIFTEIKDASSDELKDSLNQQLIVNLAAMLALPETFEYPFDSLQYLGKVYSSDGQIRLFTWNYPTRRGWQFNGFIQSKKGNIWQLLAPQTYEPSETGEIALEKWYGALYYEVIACKLKRQTAYVLLGWSQKEECCQTKMIDLLVFDGEKPHLGKAIFETSDEQFVCRRVFRYDKQAIVNLFFDTHKKQIVFDHLSPIHSGGYLDETTFGPDMSVDAYSRRGKVWILKEDIRVQNK